MSPKKDNSSSYNRFKQFKGQHYTGMAIGRTHHWRYQEGDWKEKKVTPEKWEFSYSTIKRRAGKAPEGSGVPVGTAYHWFMLSHQYVEKLNANDYITRMVGLKFKLAHRRADKGTWSASGDVRRKHLIAILQAMINELKKEPEQLIPVPLELEYNNQRYTGTAIPVPAACEDGTCFSLDVTLNNEHFGIIRQTPKGWKISGIKSQGLVDAVGERVENWYKAAA